MALVFGGACDDVDRSPVEGPVLLSQAGLYADFAARRVDDRFVPYSPRYALWSDGSEKERWLRVPDGMRIDTSDPDAWGFPVGTTAFKHFLVDGKLVETRMLKKVRRDVDGWWMMAYLWRADGSDADAVADGAADVFGTGHDVPSQLDCARCHDSLEMPLIGVSAVQLEVTRPEIARLLSHAPRDEFVVPGQGPVQEALGRLHANCAHCHNSTSRGASNVRIFMELRTTDRVPEATQLYLSTIGKKMRHNLPGDLDVGVVPGRPEQSQLLYRLATRDPFWQMPPIASERIDEELRAIVTDWIANYVSVRP